VVFVYSTVHCWRGGNGVGEIDTRRFRWRCNRGRGGWSYTTGTAGGAAVGESEAASVVEASS